MLTYIASSVAPRTFAFLYWEKRMASVGLKTLKNKLSDYIRLASTGETVVVTNRGEPVAEINPPRRRSDTWREARHPGGLVHAGKAPV